MKPRFRVAFALVAVVVLCAILPVVFSLLFTPPRDALYRVPGLVCMCGYVEYIAFDKDRLIWWNIGHNSKEEAMLLIPTNQREKFDLLNYELKPVGSVEFLGHHIRLQIDDKPPVDFPREWNPYRVWLEHFYGRNESPIYQSLEDIKRLISEERTQRTDAHN